jgi:aminodeoxyfutalosine deaminase
MVEVSAFVAALPKTELHLHLVGSASPETVLDLARRHPEFGVPTELDELKKFYEFTDFPHFIRTYAQVNEMVRTEADIRVLLLGIARDAAASNVRYAEVTVTAGMNLDKEISPEQLSAALVAGREEAKQQHGVELNWIFDIPGGFEAFRESTVNFALEQRPEGSVALGLAGLEVEAPRADYREDFARAGEAGLHSVVHAGETTGADQVWDALRVLHAERIGHGIGSISDPTLLDHLRDNNIPLEICPTSNVCTRAVATLPEHPLARIVRHGVPVTLSTDDPGMFGTTLNEEYQLAQDVLGLTPAELAEIARNGFRYGYCSAELRERALADIDAVVKAQGQ